MKWGQATLNPYVYCQSNPLALSDPAGLGALQWFNENLNPAYWAIVGCHNADQARQKGMPVTTTLMWSAVGAMGIVETLGVGFGGTVLVQKLTNTIATQIGKRAAREGAEQAAESIGRTHSPLPTGYSSHALNQAISREGHGVSSRAILDAWRNPVSISTQPGGRLVLRGPGATIVVNDRSVIITTWATSRRGFRF